MVDPEPDSSIPLPWIAVFLLLALGLAAAGVLFVGGELTGGSFLAPPVPA